MQCQRFFKGPQKSHSREISILYISSLMLKIEKQKERKINEGMNKRKRNETLRKQKNH
jgi:hypothetical protein